MSEKIEDSKDSLLTFIPPRKYFYIYSSRIPVFIKRSPDSAGYFHTHTELRASLGVGQRGGDEPRTLSSILFSTIYMLYIFPVHGSKDLGVWAQKILKEAGIKR
jgi:hypothetical protein